MAKKRKIRVLIVDDQPTVREFLDRGLSDDPEIEVVDRAADPFIARDKIVRLRPDVLTLDVEMPRMNGVEFLRRLMPQFPLPVVMVSSLTKEGKSITFDALEAGAVDFVTKPDGSPGSYERMLQDLKEKIKIAATVNVDKWLKIREKRLRAAGLGATFRKPEKIVAPAPPPRIPPLGRKSRVKLIAIGASTGGTVAIREILRGLPPDVPGIVLVQHMPAGFTALFAKSLNEEFEIDVKEAENGELIVPGRVLIAPGDFHMAVKKDGGFYKISVFSYEKVQGHRPSVDVLFDSIAETRAGADALGVILTGMGRDGALGLLKMRSTGSHTIGQDENTCIVYGMPKVANDLGAVEKQAPLDKVAQAIQEKLLADK